MIITVSPEAAVGQGHEAADRVEAALDAALPGSDVVVHVEPREDEIAIRERAHAAALAVPGVREVHNVSVLDVAGRTEVSLHLKLPGDLSLEQAHNVASAVERAIVERVPEVDSVQTHVEPLAEAGAGRRADDVDAAVVERIVRETTGAPPREVRFVQTDDGLLAYLTLALDADTALADAHTRASEIEERIRRERPDIADVIEGEVVHQLAAQTLQSYFTGGGTARRHAEFALDDVVLRPPVLHPPSVRDFYAFEQHVKTARASRGLEMPKEWYEIPVFYFSNPAAIYGPGDEVPHPGGTRELDYELEVAAIIGADQRIGGFTVMNDWSARDVQRAEMRVGLGPSKGKDFATSLGPLVVTPDEFDGRSGRMTARVNGEERSRGNLADMYHSWDAIVSHAARNTRLLPGDVLGSGTVGTGCILELGDGRWLRRGDLVELEVEGIGVLLNRVV